MEMGDKKIPYTPSHAAIRDDVIGKEFAACMMRSCPHPYVVKKYGTGGVANVSYWTCNKCKYKIKFRYHGGLGCDYGRAMGEVVPPGTESQLA